MSFYFVDPSPLGGHEGNEQPSVDPTVQMVLSLENVAHGLHRKNSFKGSTVALSRWQSTDFFLLTIEL